MLVTPVPDEFERIDGAMSSRNVSVSIAVAVFFTFGIAAVTLAQSQDLKYVPAPVDNPLKGLVPYAGDHQDRFPHSMEFNYLPLSDLLVAKDTYDWDPLERLLNDIAGRKHQTVFRIWMEYPGKTEGIPPYLETQGLKVTEWLNTNTEPFPPTKVRTPDYEDPRLRSALRNFILEMGKRYDGDPRIAYITAGLIGTWGEWHTYPRTDLMASKPVQNEIMDAYEKAFKRTPILLRYPAGENSFAHAPNHHRRMGYHDDSFCWATLDTGRPQDNWFFMPALQSAGPSAIEKWKSVPIGGEIRPEVWGQVFDRSPSNSNAQDFRKCVDATHATWLMDTGMFRERQSHERIENAKREVRHMGYEFHITQTDITVIPGKILLSAHVRNLGVAPFYFDWEIELASMNAERRVLQRFPTNWSLTKLLPDDSDREWKITVEKKELSPETQFFALRAVNPMKGGLPLRFANAKRIQQDNGWLLLGEFNNE